MATKKIISEFLEILKETAIIEYVKEGEGLCRVVLVAGDTVNKDKLQEWAQANDVEYGIIWNGDLSESVNVWIYINEWETNLKRNTFDSLTDFASNNYIHKLVLATSYFKSKGEKPDEILLDNKLFNSLGEFLLTNNIDDIIENEDDASEIKHIIDCFKEKNDVAKEKNLLGWYVVQALYSVITSDYVIMNDEGELCIKL